MVSRDSRVVATKEQASSELGGEAVILNSLVRGVLRSEPCRGEHLESAPAAEDCQRNSVGHSGEVLGLPRAVRGLLIATEQF